MNINRSKMKFGLQVVLLSLIFLFYSAFSYAKFKIDIVSDISNTSESATKNDIGFHIFNKIRQSVSSEIEIDFMKSRQNWQWLLLQRSDNVCLYNKVITNKRKSYALFSKFPITVFPDNQLILNKMNVLPEVVSLKEVVIDAKLHIGYVEGRSYSETIDRQIEKYKSQMVAISGDYGTARLRDILSQNKIDGIIEYSQALKVNFKDDVSLTQFSVHQILPSSGYINGYIACSNSPTGKKAIEVFNKAIMKNNIQKFIIAEHLNIFPAAEEDLLVKQLNNK